MFKAKEAMSKVAARVRERRYLSAARLVWNNVVPRSVFDVNRFLLVGMFERPDFSRSERHFAGFDVAICPYRDLDETDRHRFSLNPFMSAEATHYTAFIVRKKGHYVGRVIFCEGSRFTSRSGCLVHIEEHAAWLDEIEIADAYRMSAAFSFLVRHVFDYAHARGCAGVFGEIHFENDRSIKSHLRIGFEVLTDVHSLNVLGVRYFFSGRPGSGTPKGGSATTATGVTGEHRTVPRKGVHLGRLRVGGPSSIFAIRP